MGRRDKPVAAHDGNALLTGAQMRVARQNSRVSLTEMANRVSYTKGYLSAVENGKWHASPLLVGLYERELGLAAGVLVRSDDPARNPDNDEASPPPDSMLPDNAERSTPIAEDMRDPRSCAWDVYVSGALTGLSPREHLRLTTQVYDRVAHICVSMDLRCYCPHRTESNTSKSSRALVTDWDRECELLTGAGALVAYVGVPAFAVGAQLEVARAAQIPIILLCEASKLEQIPDLVLMNSSIKRTIIFEEPHELESPLRETLFGLFSLRTLEAVAVRENWPMSVYQQLRYTLDEETRSSGGRRSLTSKPITEEEWKHQAYERPTSNNRGHGTDSA